MLLSCILSTNDILQYTIKCAKYFRLDFLFILNRTILAILPDQQCKRAPAHAEQVQVVDLTCLKSSIISLYQHLHSPSIVLYGLHMLFAYMGEHL